jgi:hypothetical protein
MQKTPELLRSLRLQNQHVGVPVFTQPLELVEYMGALQAQDFNMSQWAIGLRLVTGREAYVTEAINRAEIIRTHIMRPTWHLVPAPDLRWMMQLTAPALLRALLSGDRAVGLEEKDFLRSNRIIEKALRDGNYLSREELKQRFEDAGLDTGMNLPAHMLMHAELAGILCSGPVVNGKATYALVDEWIPEMKELSREEAMAELCKRFFTSHGPATLRDFSWWSGMNLTDSRRAHAMVCRKFTSVSVGEEEYWWKEQGKTTPMDDSIQILPAYDEYVISYKDRSLVLPPDEFHKAVLNNGMFYPIVLHRGAVIGTWKREKDSTSLRIRCSFFRRFPKKYEGQLEEAARQYGNFLGKKVLLEKG